MRQSLLVTRTVQLTQTQQAVGLVKYAMAVNACVRKATICSIKPALVVLLDSTLTKSMDSAQGVYISVFLRYTFGEHIN